MAVCVSGDWNYTFNVMDYHWSPSEDYFDVGALSHLPCRTVPYAAFYARMGHEHLDTLMHNPLYTHSPLSSTEAYYDKILRLSVPSDAIFGARSHTARTDSMTMSACCKRCT